MGTPGSQACWWALLKGRLHAVDIKVSVLDSSSFKKMRSLLQLRLLRHTAGLRYATDIFLGTLFLWVSLRAIGDRNPVWAIISFVVVSDPDLRIAWPNFVSRFLNTLIGCTTGVLCLFVFGLEDWLLAPVLALTVLVCTNMIKMSSSWKIAPATSALILTSALVEHSSLIGFEQALRRTGEVLFGSLVALLISLVGSRFWTTLANQPEKKKHINAKE